VTDARATSPPADAPAVRASVAMCTYNGIDFVAEQLRSIAAQRRPVAEIVVCDDGSTDGTTDAVEQVAAEAALPVRLVRNPRRLGVTKNFEQAISICTGEVIALCDQDDVWHPEKVATLVDRLAGGAALAFSNGEVVDADLSPAGYRLWDSVWFDGAELERVRRGDAVPVLLRHAVAAGATLAFRAEYRPLLLPIPDLPHSHDIWVTLLLACVGRIEPIDRDLVRYRLHSANTVGLRRHGLIDQVRMARRQLRSNTFAFLADLCAAAHDRLLAHEQQWPVRAETLSLLRAKVDHSRRRHDMPRQWRRRLGVVGREVWRGNYAKFSYGYKSVLQDLFLR
jgi:glycosyltransferase involved in cell wall biosynthesis